MTRSAALTCLRACMRRVAGTCWALMRRDAVRRTDQTGPVDAAHVRRSASSSARRGLLHGHSIAANVSVVFVWYIDVTALALQTHEELEVTTAAMVELHFRPPEMVKGTL